MTNLPRNPHALRNAFGDVIFEEAYVAVHLCSIYIKPACPCIPAPAYLSMHTSTEASPSAVNDPYSLLDIVPLQDASATPALSSNHASIVNTTTTTPENCVITIQNNYIAEGGTINIFSSHCTSSSELFTHHVPIHQKLT